MATQNTPAQALADPAPPEPTPTTPTTLPEMPPAETFRGLIAYAVDTATNQSKQLPLEFLADGVEACIEATAHAIEQTALAQTATTATETATAHAIEATAAANTAASDLEQLKTDCADATTAANKAAETANAQATAAGNAAETANTAAETANQKAGAASDAAQTATAAAARANEAAQNITDDVSALVLVEDNKPRIQELAGIDYSILTEQEVPGEFFVDLNGNKKQVYSRTFKLTLPILDYPTESRGAWGGQYSIPGISGILDAKGTVAYGSTVMAIFPFKDFLFYAEILGQNIAIGGRAPKEDIGTNIKVNVVIQYTK